MSDKKRRWKCSQMGVECWHSDVESQLDELKAFDECGRDGDSFTLTIVDMTDEDFEALPEFEGR